MGKLFVPNGFWRFDKPAMLVKVLYQNRRVVGMHETRRTIGYLYNGYRMDFYFWEIIILAKKICMVGTVHFFHWLGASVQIPVT